MTRKKKALKPLPKKVWIYQAQSGAIPDYLYVTEDLSEWKGDKEPVGEYVLVDQGKTTTLLVKD